MNPIDVCAVPRTGRVTKTFESFTDAAVAAGLGSSIDVSHLTGVDEARYKQLQAQWDEFVQHVHEVIDGEKR